MPTSQAPLVSVLTPVYNGDAYLRDCIESVLAQTYPHWEYVIVDNCSTDRTLEIAREYAAKDARIRISNNTDFVRAIENHNNAFRQISPDSRYCKIVAADDWLFPECLEQMVRIAEEHPSVAIVGAYGLRETEIESVGLKYPSRFVSGREICRARLLGGAYYFGAPTSVLYRSSIVRSRHAFYNETNLHADSEVCFEFLKEHDFGFVHQVLTFRRERSDSLTALSRKLNTYSPMILLELVKYGPIYLTEAELRQRIQNHLRSYYAYLGRQLLKVRERDYWKFHRSKLAELGYPMSAPRVAAAALAAAFDFLLNPKNTFEEARLRIQGKYRPYVDFRRPVEHRN